MSLVMSSLNIIIKELFLGGLLGEDITRLIVHRSYLIVS